MTSGSAAVYFPTSLAQQRFWFLQALEPDKPGLHRGSSSQPWNKAPLQG